ncbi:mitochondrial pyruvate carrier 2-like [Sycon ciliatum]|uniref:mitochondrial pyruvate carrier 2-like n=1 Tax=Sycon ciliatum TaxID=27933 RepID=UPI0020ACC576|eukprot:scpid70886/ scgid34686/ Brain protein 44
MSFIYRRVISFLDPRIPNKMRPIWEHPAGLKTVHFWAPTFKWGLVIAGIADMARPADKLSDFQSTALAATGTIWARYSLVIIPKNWNLFAVNLFVGTVGYIQVYRIYQHKKPLAPPDAYFWNVIRFVPVKSEEVAKDDESSSASNTPLPVEASDEKQ